MPLSPQVERTPDKSEDPRWCILTFPSIEERADFQRRFAERDLSKDKITHPGRKLRVGPVTPHWLTGNEANRPEPLIDENRWNSASSATIRERCGWGGEGQRTGHNQYGALSYNREGVTAYYAPNHHCNSEHVLPHGDLSHPAAFGVQRSSSSWEFAPPPMQPISLRTPYLPQQYAHPARPLSNGCPAVSIVGPGVTWGYFGSGYDVLWGMGLGAVCISRIR